MTNKHRSQVKYSKKGKKQKQNKIPKSGSKVSENCKCRITKRVLMN